MELQFELIIIALLLLIAASPVLIGITYMIINHLIASLVALIALLVAGVLIGGSYYYFIAGQDYGNIIYLIFIFCIMLFFLAIVIMLPWLLHIHYSHSMKFGILEKFKDNEKIDDSTLKQLLSTIPKKEGMTRFTIMSGVVIIIGTIIYFILIMGGTTNLNDQTLAILQTVLGVLTGAFSAIIGFYFGGRVNPETHDQSPTENIIIKVTNGGEKK